MNTCIKSIMAAVLAGTSSVVAPEDIDLFIGVDSTTVPAPNVLIIIDNTANWNDAFTPEMTALANTVNAIAVDKVRLGFMMYTETGGGNGNPDGAYVRAAVRTMTAANKPLYQALVNSFDKIDDKSNNGKLGLTMSEVYRYYGGKAAYAGYNKVKRDYSGNVVSGYTASNNVYALTGNALVSASATTYVSPWDASSCQPNYVIFLSNGKSNDNTNDNTEARSHLQAAGGNTTTIPLVPSGYQDDVADEWSRFLANPATSATPRVITYVIDVQPTQKGQYLADYQALLKSMANQGSGKYFYVGTAGDPNLGTKIQTILQAILSEIAAVNTAFSSASLPVSVNTQGVYLNQVFIGMFATDKDKLPRWLGNLKQYQMRVEGDGELRLADCTNAAAINPLTGFITPCARSYWTPLAVDTYWSFKQATSFTSACPTVQGAAASNYPDGDYVEKGAAGYRLRGIAPTNRIVKTCTGSCVALSDFNDANSNIVASNLGVPTAADRTNLINWTRGQDIQDEQPGGNTTEMRPSVHGDVVHSQPLAVDYGSGTGVVAFYGGNDGMLHAVQGKRSTYSTVYTCENSIDDGNELWSFVAPETFGRFLRLWNNSPVINFPAKKPGDTSDTKNYADNKDYFIDGNVTGYRASSGATWIYASMRRGGRSIYAFNVTAPASPSLLWKRGCPNAGNDTGCDSNLTGIGQTWSSVQTFFAAGYADSSPPNNLKPLAIFGGGYDVCEDNEPNSCTAPKGNRLFVVDAQNGTWLKTLETPSNTANAIRSIVGEVTVVDVDLNGTSDLAYAVDTGGNVYRVNIGTAAPADWTLTQIAALGCDAPPCAASATLNRKFLFAPEVVVTNNYNAVLVGSGDREHPLASNQAATVKNAFFMVKDKPSDATWLSNESTNCSQPLICLSSLLPLTPEGDNPTTDQLNAKKGWYLAFGYKSPTTGYTADHVSEQVVTAALVVGGVVYFSTHTPTANTAQLCGPNLGTARAYAVKFANATSPDGTPNRFSELVGGGLPPSPVGGLVDIGGKVYPFVIGGRQLKGGTSSGLEVQNAGLEVAGVRSRTYWYVEPAK